MFCSGVNFYGGDYADWTTSSTLKLYRHLETRSEYTQADRWTSHAGSAAALSDPGCDFQMEFVLLRLCLLGLAITFH